MNLPQRMMRMTGLVAAGLLCTPGTLGFQPAAPYAQPQPIRPNLPGAPADELGLASVPPLSREGTFVSSGRGQALKGKSGRWFFVFDPDAAGRTLPPMALLPTVHLAAVERAAERNPAGTRLLVTGRVTAYQGLNYLLLASPPLLVRAGEPAAALPTPPSPAPAESPTAESAAPPRPDAPTPPAEPSIEDIVAKLDSAASKVAATSPNRPAPTVPVPSSREPAPAEPRNAASGAGRALLPAGLIVSRRGRIMRASDGAMVFTFDSGTDGGGGVAGPLVLLPCQNLAAVEELSERGGGVGAAGNATGGEGATYSVTGEVMTYRGRNYLLLTSYLANRATEQVLPAQ